MPRFLQSTEPSLEQLDTDTSYAKIPQPKTPPSPKRRGRKCSSTRSCSTPLSESTSFCKSPLTLSCFYSEIQHRRSFMGEKWFFGTSKAVRDSLAEWKKRHRAKISHYEILLVGLAAEPHFQSICVTKETRIDPNTSVQVHIIYKEPPQS